MAGMTKAQLEAAVAKLLLENERLQKASVKANVGKSGFHSVAKDKDGYEVGATFYEGGTGYATVKWQTTRGESKRNFPLAALKLLLANGDDVRAALED